LEVTESGEYSKLYKKLAKSNRNQDVRRQAQTYLDTYLENQLSPMLWMQVNPNYRLDNKMNETQFRVTHTGAKEEPTDKVYFRRADEVSKFAEALFKSKILVSKK